MGGRTKKQHLKQYEHYRCQAEVVASPKWAEKLSLFSSHKFVDVDKHTVPFTFTDLFPQKTDDNYSMSNESRPGHLFPKRNTQAPSWLPYQYGATAEKRVVAPRSGDKVRQLHTLWWMSYACMSLPSSDDAGKIWGHLFLNEMVGHVFKQACNYESCKVSTTLKRRTI